MGRLIPPSSIDRVLFSVFLVGGHLYLWYEICIVLPHYNFPHHLQMVNYVVAAWIYFNIISNIFIMRFSHYGGEPSMRLQKQAKDWTLCGKCQDYFPPRSHHCKNCNECILRRDHHCWFAGCCVSAGNYPNFLVALTYIFLAAIYGNIINFSFICDIMGGASFGTFLCILLPHVALVFGKLTLLQLFVSLMTLIAYLVMFLTGFILQIQCVQISKGQTKYEKKKDIRVYDRGFWNNVHDHLGKRWYLIWLWPWVGSPPTDDGMSYIQESPKTV